MLDLPPNKNTLGDWLQNARQGKSCINDYSSIDIQVIAAELLGKSRAWVIAHPEFELSIRQFDELNASLQRLQDGVPLPYITGIQEFFGMDMRVNPHVLIPRPETELLVDLALEWLKEHPLASDCLDVFTGCGCVAVAVTRKFTQLQFCALDISYEALKVAQENINSYHLGQSVHLVRCDVLNCIVGSFDLILANPPYIPSDRLSSLAVSRHEPRLALDGGRHGLDLVSKLFIQAKPLLKPGGLLLCEIDETQSIEITRMAGEIFPSSKNNIINDLSGKPRLFRSENMA